jgi:hypothetical protein
VVVVTAAAERTAADSMPSDRPRSSVEREACTTRYLDHSPDRESSRRTEGVGEVVCTWYQDVVWIEKSVLAVSHKRRLGKDGARPKARTA